MKKLISYLFHKVDHLVRYNVQMAKTEHKESLKSENKEEDEV